MATETAGPVYDRTREHLGTTDVALIRMHRILLRAAKALAATGQAPPALTGDFQAIRGAEKDPRRLRGLARPRHRRRPRGSGGTGAGRLAG